MTVQEAKAKEVLNNIWDFADAQDEEKGDVVDDAIIEAIGCMEEVEQYRALGTVEELKEAKKLLEKLEELKFANEQPKTDWIPFEQREADEEEKAHFLEHYGYELEYMLCGRLPDEDEEILVTYANGNVGEDIFLRDGYECYLDSGKEFITEAIAWMPKPQPYKSALFNHRLYSQYIVKIKRIEEGFSLAGSFRKSEVLDVCPKCMEKFVEYARKEGCDSND